MKSNKNKILPKKNMNGLKEDHRPKEQSQIEVMTPRLSYSKSV